VVALLVAATVGLLTAILGTPLLIRALQIRGIGQQIREDGPQGHVTKAGTPTMGGLTMLAALVIAYVASHIATGAVCTGAGVLVVLVTVGAGAVGLIDDWIKISKRNSKGLAGRYKLILQTTFYLVGIFALMCDW
jgi:phospho-N-acetylmuramoyl-pentapeptide-transferase